MYIYTPVGKEVIMMPIINYIHSLCFKKICFVSYISNVALKMEWLNTILICCLCLKYCLHIHQCFPIYATVRADLLGISSYQTDLLNSPLYHFINTGSEMWWCPVRKNLCLSFMQRCCHRLCTGWMSYLFKLLFFFLRKSSSTPAKVSNLLSS